MLALTQQIHAHANKLGFELVGITPAAQSETIARYRQWIENGYAGKMGYLERHLPLKVDVRQLLTEAKSVISLAMNYYTLDPPKALAEDPARGQISRYAWGDDYHDVIRQRLSELVDFIKKIAQTELKTRVCVDTAPIIEREYAQKAGIGWIGKNTNLIHWRSGSWYFLAEVLINIDLESDTAPLRGSCGTCTRCIEACPTDAIIEPNLLDSRLCISYLTIELKESIPKALRPKIGNLIFGCDICQEVCPWNSKAVPTDEPAFQPRDGNLSPKLLSLIGMTQQEFSRRFKGSPIKRTKRRGFLRNVLVAIGNWGEPRAVPALKNALTDHEPLVRSHAAWALGKIGGDTAKQILQTRLTIETEQEVITEIQNALLETD
ncbi:tRNA epoxyqueuosine(34) reductase QueG [Candidatus Poribacteria bacterium]|nr:tRNA epoxyqueuosine(34) reductase QueG [Candidatus Poribacteria bacterium]MYH82815.1 tRNA epoxyqueuosine(34) reductase QueG [Candidatus Poribacteria bacterium]MYK96663.1 tRNA epoxyqueuosine(34) reductase QueG [Candidatus Poribacteria bacterium]